MPSRELFLQPKEGKNMAGVLDASATLARAQEIQIKLSSINSRVHFVLMLSYDYERLLREIYGSDLKNSTGCDLIRSHAHLLHVHDALNLLLYHQEKSTVEEQQ